MKFTNVFSLGLVAASAFTVSTALPISSTGIVARQPYPEAIVLARSWQELDARDPSFWSFLLPVIKPLAGKLVSKIPKVGNFLSGLFKRDGTIDEDAVANLVAALADQNNVAARSFELDARDPFLGGFLKRIAKPFISRIPTFGPILSKFFRRDGSIDEDFVNAVVADLSKENSVVARAFTELDARDPFLGGFFRRIAKPFVSRIPTFGPILSKFFRRDGSVDEDLVNAVLADLGKDNSVIARAFFSDLEARDDLDDLVKAIADASE